MTAPLTVKEIEEAFHKPQSHRSSLSRFFRRFATADLIFLTLLILLFTALMLWFYRVDEGFQRDPVQRAIVGLNAERATWKELK